MKRYLKLYRAFFKNSLMREMQFRGHFWLYLVINIIWAGLAMVTFLFIFNQVSQVKGWTFPAMLLLTATFYFFDRLFNTLFEINFTRFNDLVNQGDLDLVLSKPVSSQFFISLRQTSLANLFGAVSMAVAVLWLLDHYFTLIFWPNLVVYAYLLLCGLIVVYALWFMSLTFVFWWGNVENIHHLFRPFYEVVRIPTNITGKILAPALTYFLPLAFVATVPVKVLIGTLNWPLVGFGTLAAVFWLWLSHKFWRFALKHYSSASS